MTTDFKQMYREARERGMRDHERGFDRDQNPYQNDKATSCAREWEEGWDDAKALDEQDRQK